MSPSHNRNLIIVILGALSTISPFAIDMYLPAFPEMAAALHTDTAKISLSLSSYFAGMAAAQLFYGPLLDRFGRKLPLYAGLVLFVAASMLCLCAHTVEWLIALRFVQALGGCAAQVPQVQWEPYTPSMDVMIQPQHMEHQIMLKYSLTKDMVRTQSKINLMKMLKYVQAISMVRAYLDMILKKTAQSSYLSA